MPLHQNLGPIDYVCFDRDFALVMDGYIVSRRVVGTYNLRFG